MPRFGFSQNRTPISSLELTCILRFTLNLNWTQAFIVCWGILEHKQQYCWFLKSFIEIQTFASAFLKLRIRFAYAACWLKQIVFILFCWLTPEAILSCLQTLQIRRLRDFSYHKILSKRMFCHTKTREICGNFHRKLSCRCWAHNCTAKCKHTLEIVKRLFFLTLVTLKNVLTHTGFVYCVKSAKFHTSVVSWIRIFIIKLTKTRRNNAIEISGDFVPLKL